MTPPGAKIKTPMLDKMLAVKPQSQAIGEFLDWLATMGLESEELDNLLSRHLGGLFARDVTTEKLAKAVGEFHDALLARLRPAWQHGEQELGTCRDEWRTVVTERDALRATLAACVAALEYAKGRLAVCYKELVHGPAAHQSDVEYAIRKIDAVVARVQALGPEGGG